MTRGEGTWVSCRAKPPKVSTHTVLTPRAQPVSWSAGTCYEVTSEPEDLPRSQDPVAPGQWASVYVSSDFKGKEMFLWPQYLLCLMGWYHLRRP